MKNLLLTLIAIFALTFSTVAQNKVLEQVDINYYAYTENSINDSVHQIGFYHNINGDLKRDGLWKLYINGELRNEAIYKNDKLMSLMVDGVEYSAKDLYIFRLERKAKQLSANQG